MENLDSITNHSGCTIGNCKRYFRTNSKYRVAVHQINSLLTKSKEFCQFNTTNTDPNTDTNTDTTNTETFQYIVNSLNSHIANYESAILKIHELEELQKHEELQKQERPANQSLLPQSIIDKIENNLRYTGYTSGSLLYHTLVVKINNPEHFSYQRILEKISRSCSKK